MANCKVFGVGCTLTLFASSFSKPTRFTNSWSSVTKSHFSPNETIAFSSAGSPISTCGAISAAESAEVLASTRTSIFSGTAACTIILASWPAPTIPNIGLGLLEFTVIPGLQERLSECRFVEVSKFLTDPPAQFE